MMIRSFIMSLLCMFAVAGTTGTAMAAKAKSPPKQAAAQTQPININTADAETLTTIKGLGESKAKAIVSYRKSHGIYKSVDDLTKVQGVGDNLLQKIKNQLTVG